MLRLMLAYTIDGVSGLTAADGSFDYASGDSIVFSIGNVTLVQLIQDGATNQDAVINRARLLQYLDANQDTSDGISIPETLRDAAADWSITDFSDNAAFHTNMAAIQEDVEAAISGAALPSSADGCALN